MDSWICVSHSQAHMYIVSQKHVTKPLSIPSSNIDRFSQNFKIGQYCHCWWHIIFNSRCTFIGEWIQLILGCRPITCSLIKWQLLKFWLLPTCILEYYSYSYCVQQDALADFSSLSLIFCSISCDRLSLLPVYFWAHAKFCVPYCSAPLWPQESLWRRSPMDIAQTTRLISC